VKLSKDLQKQTDEAPDSGFPVFPEMAIHCRLMAVTPSDGNGPSGHPYWTWEYECVEDRDVECQVRTVVNGEETYTSVERNTMGQKFWNTTSLSPQAAFSVKQSFDAFGAEYGTDTEELLGGVVKLQIGVRTIQQGDRKGELANQVNRVSPKDADFEAPAAATASTGGDDLF
jgi:hypothetical protein